MSFYGFAQQLCDCEEGKNIYYFGPWRSSGWTRGIEAILMRIRYKWFCSLLILSHHPCVCFFSISLDVGHTSIFRACYLMLSLVLPPAPQSPPDYYFTVVRAVLVQRCRTSKSFFLWKIILFMWFQTEIFLLLVSDVVLPCWPSRPIMMMSENLEQSDDVSVLPPHEVEPPREEDGHCPLPFRWVTAV